VNRKRSRSDVRVAWFFGGVLVLAGLSSASVAFGQASAEAHEDAESHDSSRARPRGWEFTLGTYLWATGLSGDATVEGRQISIDANFIDIVKASDSLLAFDLLFVARTGKWGFLVDPLYMKVGGSGEGPLGLRELDLTARIVNIETTGFYTFYSKALRTGGKTTISIDALLGLRTWWLGLTAEGSGGRLSDSGGQAWVDPLAGLTFRFDLARGHVPILVRGDFGGWGVGSTIAWAATASVGYRWLLRRLDIGLDLAYRALGPDYSNESKGVGWDVIMHGPVLAIVFEF